MDKSLKTLKTEILSQMFPAGTPENLVTQLDALMIEGLADIQKWVDLEKASNCNVIRFCKTFHRNAMTVVPAPRGIIHRVYTIADDDWNRPVIYVQESWPKPESWSGRFRKMLLPLVSGIARLPLGFEYANERTDLRFGNEERPFHRAHSGIWAIHDRNIYISPWIQSNEMVVIEWTGIKPASEWTDDDLVSDAVDFKKVLKLYVQYAHERDYGSDTAKENRLHDAYDDAMSDLMLQAKWETDVRPTETSRKHHHSIMGDLLSVKPMHSPPPKPDELLFAHIGNAGAVNSNADAVAALVLGWDAEAILSAGGHTDGTTAYDLAIGRNYYSMIEPYVGVYGEGAQENKFWPSLDDADYTLDSTLAAYKAFFKEPNNGRYYDKCYGRIHFFFVDGSASDTDGNAYDSKQADWLRIKLMLSTSAWKVVIVAKPPYSSSVVMFGAHQIAVEDANLRWPFKAWGADLVLSGGAQDYERFLVDGLPYIVNGLGGMGLDATSPTPITGSQLIYATTYGAGAIFVTPTSLTYNFYATDGTIVDVLQLTKAATGSVVTAPTPPVLVAATAAAGGAQVLTGSWADPNSNITPPNQGAAAIYIQDTKNAQTYVSMWSWSINKKLWIPLIT